LVPAYHKVTNSKDVENDFWRFILHNNAFFILPTLFILLWQLKYTLFEDYFYEIENRKHTELSIYANNYLSIFSTGSVLH